MYNLSVIIMAIAMCVSKVKDNNEHIDHIDYMYMEEWRGLLLKKMYKSQ